MTVPLSRTRALFARRRAASSEVVLPKAPRATRSQQRRMWFPVIAANDTSANVHVPGWLAREVTRMGHPRWLGLWGRAYGFVTIDQVSDAAALGEAEQDDEVSAVLGDDALHDVPDEVGDPNEMTVTDDDFDDDEAVDEEAVETVSLVTVPDDEQVVPEDENIIDIEEYIASTAE